MTDDVQSLQGICGTSVHAMEALLTIFQEQRIKQEMVSSYIASGALEGRSSQIYDLDRKDQIYIREDGTPLFKLHEHFESSFCTASAQAAKAQSSVSQSDESTDKSPGVMDCGASIAITGPSLIVLMSRSINNN